MTRAPSGVQKRPEVFRFDLRASSSPIGDVERKGDLVTLETATTLGEDDSAKYARVNRAIVNEAISLATQQGKAVAALRIWDGKTRGSGDLTEDFGQVAHALNLAVSEISTR